VLGAWSDKWVVIATDQLDDPIFADLSTGEFSIYSAVHGEGTWEPYLIADSLAKFKAIIQRLQTLSIGRTNPIEIERDPINDENKAQFLSYVSRENPNTELFYWETFFL
jgi:hypothetical protein